MHAWYKNLHIIVWRLCECDGDNIVINWILSVATTDITLDSDVEKQGELFKSLKIHKCGT